MFPAFASNPSIPALSPQTWVVDGDDVLSAGVERELTALASQLEADAQFKIVVATMPTLPEGKSLRGYANELAQTWGLNKIGQNQTLLILG